MKLRKELVLSIILNYFEVEAKSVFVSSRKRDKVYVRQMFFYMSRKWTKESCASIGELSLNHGRKKPHDHASVLHGVKKISDYIETEPEIAEDAIKINEILSKQEILKLKEDPSVTETAKLSCARLRIESMDAIIKSLEFDLKRVLAKGLNIDEKHMLQMYRDLPTQKKNDVMYKVKTAYMINKKIEQTLAEA